MATSQLTPEQLTKLRRALLKKGAELNEKLTKLLAGQQIHVEDLLNAKPGETPIEKLRRYLNHVDAQIKDIAAGAKSYGRCVVCGKPLSLAELEALPWADTCRGCAPEHP
jgi:RNA polymerase-binding transcription factor DksA